MHGDHRTPRRRSRGQIAWPLILAIAAAFAWNRLSRVARSDASPAALFSPAATPAPSDTPEPLATAPPRPHIVADPQPVPILVYHHVLTKAKGPPRTRAVFTNL